MKKPTRGMAVKNLFGDRFIPPKLVRRSMVDLESRLSEEFKERTNRRAQLAEQMRKFRAPLIELISKDRRAADAINGMHRMQTVAQKRKRLVPHRTKIEERIFAGSFGATRVPPYDYQWTLSAVNGNPEANTENADERSGSMSLSLWTDENNSSSISGRAAVGIYFYPPASNGSLQVWSTPAFTYDWGDICNFDTR